MREAEQTPFCSESVYPFCKQGKKVHVLDLNVEAPQPMVSGWVAHPFVPSPFPSSDIRTPSCLTARSLMLLWPHDNNCTMASISRTRHRSTYIHTHTQLACLPQRNPTSKIAQPRTPPSRPSLPILSVALRWSVRCCHKHLNRKRTHSASREHRLLLGCARPSRGLHELVLLSRSPGDDQLFCRSLLVLSPSPPHPCEVLLGLKGS